MHLFFPVIPAVKAALGLSDAHAQLTFSISLFGMAFATLVLRLAVGPLRAPPGAAVGAGAVPDRQRRFGGCGYADELVLGRLVQAIGAGCSLTLVRAIARDAYRAEQLVKAIAYLTMFGTIGPMVSPFMGGVLIDMFGWRSVFGFALLAGAAIALMV